MTDAVLAERRRELADALAVYRAQSIDVVPDDRDLRFASWLLDRFGSDELGPRSWCAGCVARRLAAFDVHETARGPVLACGDCDRRFSGLDALVGHTKIKHGRRPTREERTPVTAAMSA